jgi:hypothetical protein
LLIALAVAGAFTLSRLGGNEPSTRFVIASKAVAAGSRIDGGGLELVAMELDDRVKTQTFTDVSRVSGAIALAPLNAGQLVQAADIAPTTKIDGQLLTGHEITFPVSRDRVPPYLRRGERVAIIATYGTGNDARTTTTAEHGIVVNYEATDRASGVTRTVRLTVLLSDANTVIETVHASEVASITIVRTTDADTTLPSAFRTNPPTSANAGRAGSEALGVSTAAGR